MEAEECKPEVSELPQSATAAGPFLRHLHDLTHTNLCSLLQQQEQQIVCLRILLLCCMAESSKSVINLCIYAAEPQNDVKPVELQAGDAASAPVQAEEAPPAAVKVVRRQRILLREEWA